MSFRPMRAVVAACVSLLAAAATNAAPNRLQNREFNTDTAGWQIVAGSSQLVGDSQGCAASKAVSSFSYPDPEFGPSKVVWYTQCVALAAPIPETVWAGFTYRSVVDSVLGRLAFYSDADCAVGPLDAESATELPQGADFSTWTSSSFSAAVPEGAGSVRVRFAFEAESLGYFVRADSAFLTFAEPLFLGDFEDGTTCRWIQASE